mgnify:CR=1 FL=1
MVDGSWVGHCKLADPCDILGRLVSCVGVDFMAKKIIYPKEIVEPVKKHLVEKLSDLEKKKKKVTANDPFTDQGRINDNAAVDADAAEQFGHMQASAVKKTLDRSIIQVRKALTRIRFGKYGLCERCGKFIDTDRLMIMPETTLCVECEKKREK